MKLINPTDSELNAAFAEKVAGWRMTSGGEWRSPEKQADIREFGICTDNLEHPPCYTHSADAVIPWLEKELLWRVQGCPKAGVQYITAVCFDNGKIPRPYAEARDNSFARAAVIALLKAHGVEVEFTNSEA